MFLVSVENIIGYYCGQEVDRMVRKLRLLIAANAHFINEFNQKSFLIVPKWRQHLLVNLISSKKQQCLSLLKRLGYLLIRVFPHSWDNQCY